MTEAKFQTSFTKWARHNIHRPSAFELKICKETSLPFSHIAPHQIASLKSAKERSIVYKIPDSGYDIKPFDCFVLSGAEAYIVILFYQTRGDKEFFMIDVHDFERFVETCGRKSITKEDARSISTVIGVLA